MRNAIDEPNGGPGVEHRVVKMGTFKLWRRFRHLHNGVR